MNNLIPKVAVLQRVCPNYRTKLFEELTLCESINFKLFIGSNFDGAKAKNSNEMGRISHLILKTSSARLFRRSFPIHLNLLDELNKFSPDVIICEGESHFFGYIQALLYKYYFGNKVSVMHWCFIGLPGESELRFDPLGIVKRIARLYFDGFLLYSSYSKQVLTRQGISKYRGFVATNVGDSSKFIRESLQIETQRFALRKEYNVSSRKVVIYAGSLTPPKKPHTVLDVADLDTKNEFIFWIIGDGPLLLELTQKCRTMKLNNVVFFGKVSEDLCKYFVSADVLFLPGRGGIIISEALACGLPVLAHQGDGTEHDLLSSSVAGRILCSDTPDSFFSALKKIDYSKIHSIDQREKRRVLVKDIFTIGNMARRIVHASKAMYELKFSRSRLKII